MGMAATSSFGTLRAGVGPNERVVMGMIGVGVMGTGRLNELMKLGDVDIAAVCDVDQSHREKAAEEVLKLQGRRPDTYLDFRRLLERKDLDAVAVVTPDHWHAIPTIQACQAGKDVFVEKPLSYAVREGSAMVEAARSSKRVTQMGIHIHNDLPNYRRVVELVQSGSLGRVSRVHCWKTSSTKSRGNPPDSDPPPGLDYDFWLGPAPKRPYNPLRSHRTFRHFWDYSGGTFIDFWCHITDVVFWALDLKAPRGISASGGRFFVNDATETPDVLEAVLDFPELTLIFTYHPNPLPGLDHMGHIGCVFQGTEATLVTNYHKHEVLVDGKKTLDFPRPEPSIPDSPGHLREFVDAVKSRAETTCNVGYGHRVTSAGLLANIAYRTGEKIYWNERLGTIAGSPNAARLLERTYRKPWGL
jgi:predicted dehydrogenase